MAVEVFSLSAASRLIASHLWHKPTPNFLLNCLHVSQMCLQPHVTRSSHFLFSFPHSAAASVQRLPSESRTCLWLRGQKVELWKWQKTQFSFKEEYIVRVYLPRLTGSSFTFTHTHAPKIIIIIYHSLSLSLTHTHTHTHTQIILFGIC